MFHGVLSDQLPEPATVCGKGSILSEKKTVTRLWILHGRVKVRCGRYRG